MKPLAILFSLFLLACAHSPPPPQPHYIAFVKNELNLPIVLGTINIDPSNPALHPPAIRLGIDKTAAHTSIYLSPQTVANLAALVPGATIQQRQDAAGKTIQFCRLPNGRVTIGDLSVEMPVYAVGGTGELDSGIDGVIGNDFLSHFDLKLDFKSNVMVLTRR
jgi:putative hemolysin